MIPDSKFQIPNMGDLYVFSGFGSWLYLEYEIWNLEFSYD